ncbi:hypothetical protein D915_005285 [Fasciola hepatica]|uniref:Uncharacterized protein n=1 Tax=Fasciola hepatica TaxID=6192 RepID=A0A4E0R9K8_FASHE|nr:hypothetical protein D915_005285 [Fasciola hepatica]
MAPPESSGAATATSRCSPSVKNNPPSDANLSDNTKVDPRD